VSVAATAVPRYLAPARLLEAALLRPVPAVHRLLAVALLLSVVAHASLLAVKFVEPPRSRGGERAQALEVVLVNSRTRQAPRKADALAQSNLDGGGNTDAARRAQSPLPASVRGAQVPDPVEAAKARAAQAEAELQSLLAQAKSKTAVDTRDSPSTRDPSRTPSALPSTTGSADLAARSLELARLQAQISQDWDALQQRPRRQFVGARTQEYRYARYVEDWRAKIERVGNLNYPDEARRQRVYGSLLLTVSIRRDGTVESIEINRSSGFRVLDQAAVRIVELAAPFAPFPPDIARDTDVLAITRTWSFSSGDQFQTQ
jgi:protein TonB